MKELKLKEIIEKAGYNYEHTTYNMGTPIKDLKLYKGIVYKPQFYVDGTPKYEYSNRFAINFEDYQ